MMKMSISLSSHICLFTLLCSSLLVIAVGTDAQFSWHGSRANALFIFGDSIFDAGTNDFINTTTDFQANFFPYGKSFLSYPTGRFSNGRLIPDFIAEFAGLPLILPYLHPEFRFNGGANFASGGGGALVETYEGLVVNLKTQMTQFKKLEKQLKREFGDEEARKIVLEAVYLISSGGNDYLFSTSANSVVFQSHSHEEYVGMVIGNVTTVVKDIHSRGGQKFGFVNMGPLGCVPHTRALAGSSGACFGELNELLKLHNRALPKALEKLADELDGFKYSIFDHFNAGMQRINNPSKFGFKEGKMACCGSGLYRGNYSCGGKRGETDYELCKDPSEYVTFDAFHPSERTHRQFAELMWSGRPPTTGPYNLRALFNLHKQNYIWTFLR
ncbi:GDSL esterase/lipase 1-like isoform X1 [Punica granatum]|uniref:GDSL esterase/lipase 1-like isoform X1 n=2 Tax=Punica granatum TaxID=22663 RepID=A0A6P8DVI6_PUNGR|nr:GDSL esterase/lipase 1-like isoform X1 [Punica granatum]